MVELIISSSMSMCRGLMRSKDKNGKDEKSKNDTSGNNKSQKSNG